MQQDVIDDVRFCCYAMKTMNTAETIYDQRIYRYGCLAPKDLGPVLSQMRLAHDYRRALVLIERDRRAKVRALLPEDRGLWRAAFQEHAEKIAAFTASADAKRKEARGASGLRWGTYQLVEQADQASRKDVSMTEDPRYPPWTGDGCVSEQLIKGISLEELTTDTQVQFVPGEGARGQEFGTLRLRVGSDEKRRPIWAEWPMRMHRPLPKGARIQRVTVHRFLGGARTANVRSGRRERWEVQFMLVIPLGAPSVGTGIVGVDLGWRRIGDELRVCAFADEDNKTGELRMTDHMIGGYRRVDTLRSTRDEMRERALAIVRAVRDVPGSPEWYREVTLAAHAWRNPRRIPMLLRDWAAARFAGDEEAFTWLSYWLERDRHLWQWESDQRHKNNEAKKKLFEQFAANLAKKYETVVMEEFDLRTFATRPKKDAILDPEGRKESRQQEHARAWRHLAGTYQLRLAIENAFLVRGGSACRVPAQDTTRTCSACGLIVRRDFGSSIAWTCDCGVVHDQDRNAGTNLCARFRVLVNDGDAFVRKAGKKKEDMGSRFSRARKKKQEKAAS
jgi:Putative transposase DNA-binding domain